MTLIDSRPAILASFAAVATETGVAIDPAGVDSRLGVKLETELAYWFPDNEIEAAIAIYRRHYPVLSRPLTSALPGAYEALAAVRSAGAHAVVITAKFERTARRSLDDLGLVVDAVYGEAHGPEKGIVLAARRGRVRRRYPAGHGRGRPGRRLPGRRNHRIVHRQ